MFATIGSKANRARVNPRIPRRGNPVFADIRDFGAFGDYNGTTGTDNAGAINLALAASSAIYIPPGDYLINSPLTVSNKPLLIRGDGKDVSRLIFASGVTTGLTVTLSGGDDAVSIRDLSWLTLADPASVQRTGISISWPTGWENRFTNKGYMQGVEFAGYNPLSHGWGKHVSITQGLQFEFLYCNFMGRLRDGWTGFDEADLTLSTTGVEWIGGWYPTDVDFVGCNFNAMSKGIVVGGAAEGVVVLNCTLVDVKRGVEWDTGNFDAGLGGGNAAGRPHLVVADSHMAVYEHAVFTDGVVQILIHDNAFYHSNRATSTANLLNLAHGSDARVHHNFLRKYSGGGVSANGIVIGDSSTNFTTAVVENNDIGDNFGVGVWFKSDASGCTERLNTYGTGYVTASYQDLGTGNTQGVAAAELPIGTIVGRGYAEYLTNADLSTTIPVDDTIPQNTEGTEIVTVSYACRSAGNRVRIRFNGFGCLNTGIVITTALFKDSGANALHATAAQNAAGERLQVTLEYEEAPGDTSSHTYQIRVGANTGTMRMNGSASGRNYGGVARSTLILEELQS